jgi:UPF0271 protein
VVAEELGMSVIKEAFADRRYTEDLALQDRSIPGAVLEDPEMAADQVLSIVTKQEVETATGMKTHLQADTICIHGDTPTAVSIAHTIYERLQSEGINIGSW